MDPFGNIPPQAPEIENAILGALIIESDSYSKISGILKSEMFYKNENQIIFEIIAGMHHDNKMVDLLTVVQRLKECNKLDEVGGPLYITGLTRNIASSIHIEQHTQIVVDKYILRNAILKANEIQKIAYENGSIDDISELLQQFETEVTNIFTGNEKGSSMFEAIHDTFSEIEKRNQETRSGKLPGITTGFKTLDLITGGWRKGRLIVLGGRPGHGKSSLALHFALKAAEKNIPVFFFSMEMIKTELVEICLSGISAISRTSIRDGHLSDDDFSRLQRAAGIIEKLPIKWFDNTSLTVNQICSIVRNQLMKTGKGIVIIDYLQLIRPEKTSKNQIREQQIAEISRTLKRMTISEKIPVILLSQLNRQAEGEKPKLSHLRESGSIEQDSDMVLFVWKPEKDGLKNIDIVSDYDKLLQLDIAKNRQGRLETSVIYENGEMTQFSENPFSTQKRQNENYNPDLFIQSKYDSSPF